MAIILLDTMMYLFYIQVSRRFLLEELGGFSPVAIEAAWGGFRRRWEGLRLEVVHDASDRLDTFLFAREGWLKHSRAKGCLQGPDRDCGDVRLHGRPATFVARSDRRLGEGGERAPLCRLQHAGWPALFNLPVALQAIPSRSRTPSQTTWDHQGADRPSH